VKSYPSQLTRLVWREGDAHDGAHHLAKLDDLRSVGGEAATTRCQILFDTVQAAAGMTRLKKVSARRVKQRITAALALEEQPAIHRTPPLTAKPWA
jgi:hypothetical protein